VAVQEARRVDCSEVEPDGVPVKEEQEGEAEEGTRAIRSPVPTSPLRVRARADPLGSVDREAEVTVSEGVAAAPPAVACSEASVEGKDRRDE